MQSRNDPSRCVQDAGCFPKTVEKNVSQLLIHLVHGGKIQLPDYLNMLHFHELSSSLEHIVSHHLSQENVIDSCSERRKEFKSTLSPFREVADMVCGSHTRAASRALLCKFHHRRRRECLPPPLSPLSLPFYNFIEYLHSFFNRRFCI